MRRRFTEPVDLFAGKAAHREASQFNVLSGVQTQRDTELTVLKSSRVFNSGLSPPWMHRNCLFMTAARGRVQKDSMHALYTSSEYLCLPRFRQCAEKQRQSDPKRLC